MEHFKDLSRIKEIYDKGENIIKYLKEGEGRYNNSLEDILISYELQAGTYIDRYYKNQSACDEYTKCLAGIISKLGESKSIMEVGVGEGTALNGVLNNLENKMDASLGFDISFSRLKFAKRFLSENLNLNKQDLENVNLFSANLFEIPLKDNSVDIVYTKHSIEPNGGREKEALRELYRVCKKYLVLLEPAYELASDEAKNRMKEHGYITNLYASAKDLSYKIIEHRLFELSRKPLNPTGLIIIEKNSKDANEPSLSCPITLSDLRKYDNVLFSKDSLLSYPIISDIPCLLRRNAILTAHLLD